MRRTREFATSIPDDGLSGFVDLDEILLRRQRGRRVIRFNEQAETVSSTFLSRMCHPNSTLPQSLPCSDRRGGSDPGGPRPGALGRRDLSKRLHEEFGLSVSDDTIYGALKELSFSH